MEKEEWWLVQQLVACPFKRKQILNLFPEEVQALKTRKEFTDLPVDVIALIFSWLPITQALCCMLINKASLAAMQKPQAWRRNVHACLSRLVQLRLCKDRHVDPILGQKCAALFDAFCAPFCETLEERLKWLFDVQKDVRSSSIALWESHRGCIVFERSTKNYLQIIFAVDGSKIEWIRFHQTDPPRNTRSDFGTKIIINPTKQLRAEFHKGVPVVLTKFSKKYNATWIGNFKHKHDSKFIPKGKGKWTFAADGFVLEGDNVAVKGAPAYNILPEEFREFKRLKSNMQE